MLKRAMILAVCLSFSGNAQVRAAGEIFARVAGWEATSEVSTYDQSNLWKYINGAADQYFAYGFELLSCSDMTKGDLTVIASIYDMGTRLNAFGIYGIEHSAAAETLAIGAGAQVSAPYQGLMLKDRYYIRIDAFKGEMTDAAITDLLREMAKVLPGSSDLPTELAVLPPEGKVAGTEAYTRESYLGMSDLRCCLHARYSGRDDQELEIFAIVPEKGQTAEQTWEKLAQKWSAASGTKKPILSKDIPYEGPVGVIRTDKGIYGVFGAADETGLIGALEHLSSSLDE